MCCVNFRYRHVFFISKKEEKATRENFRDLLRTRRLELCPRGSGAAGRSSPSRPSRHGPPRWPPVAAEKNLHRSRSRCRLAQPGLPASAHHGHGRASQLRLEADPTEHPPHNLSLERERARARDRGATVTRWMGEFIAAAGFGGARDGFVFTTGELGTGCVLHSLHSCSLPATAPAICCREITAWEEQVLPGCLAACPRNHRGTR